MASRWGFCRVTSRRHGGVVFLSEQQFFGVRKLPRKHLKKKNGKPVQTKKPPETRWIFGGILKICMLPGNRGLTAPSTRTTMVKTRHIFWVPLISTHIRFSSYLRHRHKTVYRTCVERMNPNNFWKMKPVKKYENCMLTGSVGSQVRIVASCGASMYVKPCKRLVHPNAGTTDWIFFIFFLESWEVVIVAPFRQIFVICNYIVCPCGLHTTAITTPDGREHKQKTKKTSRIEGQRPRKWDRRLFFKIW